MNPILNNLFDLIKSDNRNEFALSLKNLKNKYLSRTNSDGNTLLIEACIQKREAIALDILDRNSKNGIDVCDAKGFTPLMLACISKLEPVCMKLLEDPTLCKLNHLDDSNQSTVLMFACQNKLENVCTKILSCNDIRIDHVNIHTDSALNHAIIADLEQVCITIWNHLPHNLNHLNSSQNTYLQSACAHKLMNLCKKIMDDIDSQNCHLNNTNAVGDTFLMNSIRTDGFSDISLAALSWPNTLLNTVNNEGQTPLILACEKIKKEICEKILCKMTCPEDCALDASQYNKGTALILACKNSWASVCKNILIYPKDCALGYISTTNYTALIHACNSKMTEICMEILKYPQDCSLGHQIGDHTALLLALRMNMTEVCLEMLKNPDLCNLKFVSSNGTVFIKACNKGSSQICMKILETNNMCALDYIYNDKTSLMQACDNKLSDVCLEILNNYENPYVNYVNYNNENALLLASKNKLENVCIKILSLCDLDILNKVDSYNCTVLTYSSKYNMIEACNKIMEHPHKAGIDNVDIRKRIISFAKQNNNTSLLKKIFECKPSEAEALMQEYLDDTIFQTVISCVSSTKIIDKIILLNEYNKQRNDHSSTDRCLACYEDTNNNYYILPECNHVISMCDVCKPQIIKKCCPVCRGNTNGIVKSFVIS